MNWYFAGWQSVWHSLSLCFLLCCYAAEADEIVSKQVIKDDIQHILTQAEFDTEQVWYEWRYKGEIDAGRDIWPFSLKNLSLDLASLLELLLWLALGILIGLLIIQVMRWLALFPLPVKPVQQTASPALPVRWLSTNQDDDMLLTLDGLDERAWACWQAGDARHALSLLYRGTLKILAERDQLHIQDSDTEGDCLRQVNSGQSKEFIHYFACLTRFWQQLAYAARCPSDTDMRILCEQWSHFCAPHVTTDRSLTFTQTSV